MAPEDPTDSAEDTAFVPARSFNMVAAYSPSACSSGSDGSFVWTVKSRFNMKLPDLGTMLCGIGMMLSCVSVMGVWPWPLRGVASAQISNAEQKTID